MRFLAMQARPNLLLIISMFLVVLLQCIILPTATALSIEGTGSERIRPTSSKNNAGRESTPKSYNYFAYGSNICLATMRDLRQIKPLASAPAILPKHSLRFNIPGIPLIEPSWASVEPSDDVSAMHGVVYKLSSQDFVKVCESEGVPFGYVLHRCNPVLYIGDGERAGADALSSKGPGRKCFAYTLRAPPALRRNRDVPPSRAYLNVILRGAKEYKLDADYIRYLEDLEVGTTVIGDGLAEKMLRQASDNRRN